MKNSILAIYAIWIFVLYPPASLGLTTMSASNTPNQAGPVHDQAFTYISDTAELTSALHALNSSILSSMFGEYLNPSEISLLQSLITNTTANTTQVGDRNHILQDPKDPITIRDGKLRMKFQGYQDPRTNPGDGPSFVTSMIAAILASKAAAHADDRTKFTSPVFTFRGAHHRFPDPLLSYSVESAQDFMTWGDLIKSVDFFRKWVHKWDNGAVPSCRMTLNDFSPPIFGQAITDAKFIVRRQSV